MGVFARLSSFDGAVIVIIGEQMCASEGHELLLVSKTQRINVGIGRVIYHDVLSKFVFLDILQSKE